MNYRLLLWCGIAFVLGRLSKLTYYIGTDKNKYDKADFAILLSKK